MSQSLMVGEYPKYPELTTHDLAMAQRLAHEVWGETSLPDKAEKQARNLEASILVPENMFFLWQQFGPDLQQRFHNKVMVLPREDEETRIRLLAWIENYLKEMDHYHGDEYPSELKFTPAARA